MTQHPAPTTMKETSKYPTHHSSSGASLSNSTRVNHTNYSKKSWKRVSTTLNLASRNPPSARITIVSSAPIMRRGWWSHPSKGGTSTRRLLVKMGLLMEKELHNSHHCLHLSKTPVVISCWWKVRECLTHHFCTYQTISNVYVKDSGEKKDPSNLTAI